MKKMPYVLIVCAFLAGLFLFIKNDLDDAVIPVVPTTDIVVDKEEEMVLTEKEKIEANLRENIVSLSPVKAVLGGVWYVVSIDTNLDTKTGVVIYEDGHIQEKRNFSYLIDTDGNIINLTVK